MHIYVIKQIMVDLKIATYNVRGLANFNKCREVFHYLHQKEHKKVCLQETHCIKKMEKKMETGVGGVGPTFPMVIPMPEEWQF